VLLCMIACSGYVLGQEELKSGPQPGEFIPGPFHCLNLNGAHAGNPHCLVCEYGLLPVVAVFARDTGETIPKLEDFLQKLDEAVGRHQAARLRGFAVFLSDDLAKETSRKDLLARLEAMAGKLKNVVVAVDSAAGPDKYNLNPQAAITIVLYHKHQVVGNFAFGKEKMTEKDGSAILTAVDKMVPAKNKRSN
jgi:hypothetical protein